MEDERDQSAPAELSAERVEELLAEFIERREEGEVLSTSDFAAVHPEGGAALDRALRALHTTEARFPTAADLPERIGRYRVLDEIGRGGMGRVLLVEDSERPGEKLALKLLHLAMEENPRALERFRREGQALERLQHPGVVRVREIGIAGSSPYIAMERVEGTSLAELLVRARNAQTNANEPPPLDLPGDGDGFVRAARLAAMIARAVAATHREGVLHRDITPRNVLVREDGTPVLIDFGLMRAEGTPTLTATGDMVGTPQYMAPEQARGERVDMRTDVHGLGAVLFELVTLTPPRQGEESYAVLLEAGTRPLPAPRRRHAAVPAALNVITRRALAFAPGRRYPSAEEMAVDLEAWLDESPIGARAPGPVERMHDAWLLHRRAIVGIATFVLAAVAVLPMLFGGAEDVFPRADEARNRSVIAWLDGDAPGARAAAEELRDLLPEDRVADFLLALADDRLPQEPLGPGLDRLVEAERKRRGGDPRGAIQDIEVALNLVPVTGFPLALMGLAALDANDLERAEKAWSFAARDLAHSVFVHRTLGHLYFDTERYTDACLAWETACRLEPADARTWTLLVEAALREGIEDRAAGFVTTALAQAGAAANSELHGLAQRMEGEGRTADAEAIVSALDVATGAEGD